jgi:Restriction endonuclease
LPFAASFFASRFQPAYTQLIAELDQHPDRIFEMSPRNFEIFVGSVFGSFTNGTVWHVGRSRDGGVDLILHLTDTSQLIQVKRRMTRHKVEGVNVVKQLFATMFSAKTKKGQIVTTAHRFSRDAKSWVNNPALLAHEFDIELIDLERLLSMVRAVAATIDDSGSNLCYELTNYMNEREWTETNRRPKLAPSRLNDLVHLNGFLVQSATEPEEGAYIFAPLEQDSCWFLPGHLNVELVLQEGDSGIPPRDFEVQARQMHGTDFIRLLLSATPESARALLEFWSAAKQEILQDISIS